MQDASLKATVIANYSHGSFLSGEKQFSKKEYLQAYLERQDESFFEEMGDEIACDRDENVTEFEAKAILESWMECPSIANRGHFATWQNRAIHFLILEISFNASMTLF